MSRRSGLPAYLALDTGHQTGQPRFLRPSSQDIARCLETAAPAPYVGPESAHALYDEASRGGAGAVGSAVARIEREMDRYPHLFASRGDCDLYRWLEVLGCHSPVVHLQQTNGRSSSHLPFTAANNEQGIVKPPEVLRALARSYERASPPGMPARTDDVYLTFEIFPHTSDRRRDILPALAESVRYWRRWIPEDGMRLDALVNR